MNLRAALLFAILIGAGCSAGQASGIGDDSSQDALRQCASGAKVAGIDVSYYQGTIDWEAVADVNRGDKSFAFIRVADGMTHDPLFATNWNAAAAAGLYRGAYHFFRAGDDPEQQAQLLLDAIGWQIGPQDLPPVIDLEVKDGESSAVVAAGAAKFVEYIYGALGRKPLVYTGAGFEAAIGNPSTLGQYPLWVANWTTSCPSMPARWSEWRFWQNHVASSGTVPGVHHQVDLDYFNGSAADLAAYAGPNGAD